MAKFRKKPVVIDAFLWTGDIDQVEDPEWICKAIKDGRVSFVNAGHAGVFMTIRTLEGDMIAKRGDWVICGTAGEIYPCKPAIFAEIYEQV